MVGFLVKEKREVYGPPPQSYTLRCFQDNLVKPNLVFVYRSLIAISTLLIVQLAYASFSNEIKNYGSYGFDIAFRFVERPFCKLCCVPRTNRVV